MNTIRQNIVDNITTRMALITVIGGYDTNVGQNVYEWLDYAVNPVDYPCIVVRDTDDTIDRDQSDEYIHDRRLTIELQIYTNGSGAVDECRKAIGDVVKEIGKDISFDENCYWAEINSIVIDVKHEETITAAAKITMTLYYQTEAWNEYIIINC